MPRGSRFGTPGNLHHVMIRGIERGSIVRDDKDQEEFLKRMGKLAKETATAIY